MYVLWKSSFFFSGQVLQEKKKDKSIKRKNKIKKRPLPAGAVKGWFLLFYHNCISKIQHWKVIIIYISIKNAKNNESFTKCGMKHYGVSAGLFIPNLLNLLQDFLLPSHIPKGNKLEFVPEI